MRRSAPRLIDSVHITDTDVDKVVEGGIIERHVIRSTIQLVLVERNQASVVDEVVHRQPFLEDVPKVLLRIFRPKKGRVDDL